MALLPQTIENGRFGCSSIENEIRSLVEFYVAVKNILQSNPDYVSFRDNTIYGKEIDSRLNSLLDVINNQIAPTILEITNETTSFLNRQETLNTIGM